MNQDQEGAFVPQNETNALHYQACGSLWCFQKMETQIYICSDAVCVHILPRKLFLVFTLFPCILVFL